MGQHLACEYLQRPHDLGLGQRPEVDQHPDLRDADIAQHADALDRLLRAAHQHAAGEVRLEREPALPRVALLVALVGGGVGRLARGFEAGRGVLAHRLVHGLLQLLVVVLREEMRVIDAADLMVLDATAMLTQGVAVPADALDRDGMIDVIGDVEKVVAFLRRPFEAFGREQARHPDRRMRLLIDRWQDRQAGHRRAERALEF